MRKTEKKHWENGHQIRGGGSFHTWTFSIWSFAIMISKGKGKWPIVNFYQFV